MHMRMQRLYDLNKFILILKKGEAPPLLFFVCEAWSLLHEVMGKRKIEDKRIKTTLLRVLARAEFIIHHSQLAQVPQRY